MRTARAVCFLMIVAGLAGMLRPASADWLVTTDGARIETKGPWEVKGNLVVFRLASGGLSSLRASQIDLEASAAATAAPRRPRPPKAKEAAKPAAAVLVLTDADVSHVRDGEEGSTESGGSDAGGGEDGSAAVERLVITAWEESADPQVDGVTITGRVRNASAHVSAQTTVSAALYDQEGELIGSSDAKLTATVLGPGRSANFRADFPSVFTYWSVRFETSGLALETREDETDTPRIRPDEESFESAPPPQPEEDG